MPRSYLRKGSVYPLSRFQLDPKGRNCLYISDSGDENLGGRSP
jgi:hypothetical protein